MTSILNVREHVVEGQHIREYPNGTAHSQEEVLRVAVKQYIPKDNPNPRPGDITIIGAHANGFVKELYEPLWDDLVVELGKRGIKVRGIWIADCAWQGQSGIINEDKLGNDPSWFDHSRDLLQVINHFRHEMPRPIIGVGHSFGSNIIVNLALMHPRLIHHMVVVDPVMARVTAQTPAHAFSPMKQSSFRRDLWPSREAAAASFRGNKFYSTWDPRVLDAWVKYGLRDTPSKLHPEQGAVTLTTTKHQEVFTYFRPVAQAFDAAGNRVVDPAKIVDLDGASYIAAHPDLPFYRAEGAGTLERLPVLRPSVFWIFGGLSGVASPQTRKETVEMTGSGVGGSGGAKAGLVAGVTLEKYGHLVPLEATSECARLAAESIVPALERWRQDQALYEKWTKKSDADKQTLDADFKRWIGPQKRAGKL